MKKIYKIHGMHCTSCAKSIEMELEDLGVQAKVSYEKGLAEVEIPSNVAEKKVKEAIIKLGYKIK